ncbi:MAG: hypothetical protein J6V82_04460 [Clostridia bacterium]|nr:hypothetical protein [Clostridia bacterium]MBO7150984.1 hypothetical protein [Clostridia bacterium]
MIKIEKTETFGWEPAIRGMRNPMNSWDKSDSRYDEKGEYHIGENDIDLMSKLSKAGSDHAKFMRMITVTCDITAPLYWWKEYDTYKVGTVANSCSTMHRLHSKEFELADFCWEHLNEVGLQLLEAIIDYLNYNRKLFVETKDKQYWHNMIQILPTSYEQKRTVQLNYQVLKNMYFARRNHKLDEWHTLCEWIEKLPLFEQLFM